MKNILNLILFIVLCTPVMAQSNYPFEKNNNENESIRAYWYKVPTDSVYMEAAKDYFYFHSMMQVYGAVPASNYTVKVSAESNGKTSYSREFAISSNTKRNSIPDRYNLKNFGLQEDDDFFRIDCRVPFMNELPEKLHITIVSKENKYQKTIDCRYHTISGNITDFDNKPYKAFFSVGPDEFTTPVSVWSDEKGKYSIQLPERTYNIFYVDDHTYAISTLESWSWKMIVDRDEELNYKVGNGEVYNLQVWASNGGYNTYNLFFRPMVLPQINGQKQFTDTLSNRPIKVFDIAPELKKENITVKVNGKELEIIAMQKVYDCGERKNELSGMPAYLISVKRPKLKNGKMTISLEYDGKVINKNGEEIRANSYGLTQFYNGYKGFSRYQ